jgi:anti-anti-sigma factor
VDTDDDHLRLSITASGDVAVVAAMGELDIHTAGSFLEALESVSATGVHRIVLDGHEVRFVDSAGLRALVMGRERSVAHGIQFVVDEPSAPMRHILELTGLDGMLL